MCWSRLVTIFFFIFLFFYFLELGALIMFWVCCIMTWSSLFSHALSLISRACGCQKPKSNGRRRKVRPHRHSVRLSVLCALLLHIFNLSRTFSNRLFCHSCSLLPLLPSISSFPHSLAVWSFVFKIGIVLLWLPLSLFISSFLLFLFRFHYSVSFSLLSWYVSPLSLGFLQSDLLTTLWTNRKTHFLLLVFRMANLVHQPPTVAVTCISFVLSHSSRSLFLLPLLTSSK